MDLRHAIWLWLVVGCLAMAHPLNAGAVPTLQVTPPAPDRSYFAVNAVDAMAQVASQGMFIENVGQFDRSVRFQFRGAGGTIWLAEDAMWLTVVEQVESGNYARSPDPGMASPGAVADPTSLQGVNLRLSFVGSNPDTWPQPFQRLGTHVSYFAGSDPDSWHSNVPVWGGVRYKDLYPQTDLELTVQHGVMVPLIVTRPGADLRRIRL